MNELLRCSTRLTRWLRMLGAAGCALMLGALGACAHNGTDDVKPTATTAYHSGAQPPQPMPPAASGQTRE